MQQDSAELPLSVASLSDIRVAKLVAASNFASSRWLRFELIDQRPLGFRGGQYVIVETGLTLANGRPRRRAYSLLSDDRVATQFELAVYQLAGGAGCRMMCQLELGSELRFSAPWGKLRAPVHDARGPVWLIATDSGMSAALGLLRGRDFDPHLARTQLHAWGPSLLDPGWMRARVPSSSELVSLALAPINSEQRRSEVSERVQQMLTGGLPEHVYLLGDGAVARQVLALLIERGVPPAQVQVETFFNHVERAAQVV